MGGIEFVRLDPLLPEEGARAMLRPCEGFGDGLAQRHDAAMNFVRTGGRFGRRESVARLAARTNCFRETYAYDRPVVAGSEPFLHHEGFIEGARKYIHFPPPQTGAEAR